MKLVANIQLNPTPEQARSLRDTLERCNAACNEISKRGLDAGKTRKFDLQNLLYHSIRKEFDLTAQAVIRCIGKVADAYTTQKANKREGLVRFSKLAAQPYDRHIFRFVSDNKVSIWTLPGRQKIPFVCDERQRILLPHRKSEVDLMLVRGKWYLVCVCDVVDPDQIGIEDVLGVDFGIVNLAFDGGGRPYTEADVEKIGQKLSRRRAGLQKAAKAR